MDITFDIAKKRFNYRVCAVIINDGRVLAMKDEGADYFYLTGGRVTLGETAEDAILREIQEELNITAKIDRALWFNQGFFNESSSGLDFHEICLYFLMDIDNSEMANLLARGNSFTLADHISEHQSKLHHFKWLAFDNLKDEHIYPVFLKTKIFSLPESLEMIKEYH